MDPSLVWTRDQHLLDIALYHILLDDGSMPEDARIHLQICEVCQDRLEEQRTFIAELLPPMMDLLSTLWQLNLQKGDGDQP